VHRMHHLFVIGLLLTLPSCGRQDEARELRRREAQAYELEEQVDAVDKAMPFLPMLLRLDRGPIMRDFVNQVNSWAISQPEVSPWSKSKLLEKLPPELVATDFCKRLDRIEFAELESEYLAQCKLMKDVGRWVLERPYRDSLFAPWLAEKMAMLPESDAILLEQTMKLFDWTVRNVALEGSAKDIEALIRDPGFPISDLGSGYRALPWQSMIFGRGDALQKSRVFTQLLFQQGISSVILSLPDTSPGSSEKDRLLWCIGVPIADEIYLFEMRLGIPLPLADQAAVATLREARSNPAVLRRAKLPGRFDYPVSADDLKNVVALLDIEPFAIGQAMKALEGRLAGEARMKLSIDADKIAEDIRSIEPTLETELWNLPWLSQLYNRNLRDRIGDLSPFSLKYMAEFGAYLNESIVQQARMAHFQGNFETTVDAIGAPRRYMTIRIDEATLAKLAHDTDVQRELQVLRRSNEKQEEFQFRVQQAQQFYRTAKLDSNAFLGFLQFDLDNIDAATDWLDNRLLQIEGTERWKAQARYLLGRCCEAQGQNTEAIGWYKSEGSLQEAGNRIRIRLLEKGAAAASDSKNR
jgi:hypothetical protein